MNSKERFMAALAGSAMDRIPVFPLLMSFSAKRYGVNYKMFASNAHILAESQLKASEMFAIDAITACSDAFRISADLGGNICFPPDKPPYLAEPLIKSEDDFYHLKRPDVFSFKGRMHDRIKGTGEMVKAAGAHTMVVGWVDMPFAEACSVCGVTQMLLHLYDDPEFAHQLLEFLAEIVIDFALAQLDTGAPVIGAGDAAASLISPDLYKEFALPYERRVSDAIHKAGGLLKLHICGNTNALLPDMVKSGADLFNVDHMVDLASARQVFGRAQKCIKGNLDPVSDMLQATPEQCRHKALECMHMMNGYPYMLSPGCEVPAEVNDEVFDSFCGSSQVFRATESAKS